MTTTVRIASVPYSAVLDGALALPETDAMRVAEDFFGLSDIIGEDSRLRWALTDPARSSGDKQALAAQTFGSHITKATATVVDEVVAGHWSDPMKMHNTLEVLGILSVLTDAHRAKTLHEVEAELFEVRYFLAGQRDLRLRLSDTSTGTSHERGDLATALFGARLSKWAMRLLRRAVGRSKHGRLLVNLRRFAEWAATMQNRLLVTVDVAAPMSAAQAQRLQAILEKRFDAHLSMSISVEPNVIGGFRLRAGMTAIDASIATRIADMRRALAG